MAQNWNRRSFLKSTVTLAGAGLNAAPARVSVPLIAFRIGVPLWETDDRLTELLEFFARHAGAVDELAFFTSATHPPLPLDEMERRAARLRVVMARVRGRGMRAGINILATMGHHEENLPHSLATSWQRVMDIHGKTCLGSFCPAQLELLDYARRIYAAMAEAEPDFIWVDDDVRLASHQPVGCTCFCDYCLQQFAKESGRTFTRVQLAEAFDSGSLEDRLKLRRQWLEHNRKVIDNLFRVIEEAVHKVKRGLPLGFMTGDRFYEGFAFERWARTLSGPGRAPVRWRPGGGFYSDEALLGLVDKANGVGRQVAALPTEVTVIQSELENFPYQLLRKSAHTTMTEAGAYMAAGTTGTAFNVLTQYKDPLDEYISLYDQIAQSRAFYSEMQAALGRSRALGVWPAWNRDLFSVVNVDGKWLSRGKMPLSEPYVLGEIGIPLCYDSRGRTATALCGAAPLAFSSDELREMFSGGVLLDVDAWHALKRLGLEGWTGVAAVDGIDRDATEVLSKHALNGRFAGWSRDCRQSFRSWWERAYRLRPQGEAVEDLARMVDYGDVDLGACMTAFVNELGGRVVVMGYYPWTQIHSLPKSSQMKALCGWLSHDRLPVVSESYAKVVLWVREGARGQRAVVLLNASLDPLDSVSVRFAATAQRFVHVAMTGQRRELRAESVAEQQVRVTLAGVAPWSMHLLVEV